MWDLTASEQANRAALLIVNERYNRQLAPFVKGKQARLSYVRTELDHIIAGVCLETGANSEFVTEEFNKHLAVLDAVLKNPGNLKREELTSPAADEPYSRNLRPNSDEGREGIIDADVMDGGEVPGAGREDAVTPDARVDLGQETADPDGPTEVEGLTTSSCVRCGEQKTSSISPVCKECNSALLKLAYPDDDPSTGFGAGAPEPGVQEAPAVNPNMPYACTICGQEGSADDIRAHIQRDHADVLQRQDEMSTENMGQDNNGVSQQLQSKWVLSDVPQHEDAAEIQPLPQNPGDRFDDYVQRLAETAAARKFSQPSDEDIHSISSQVGGSPDEVKNNLVTVAVFGDNVAVNGKLGGDPTPPEGYEEISAQGLSGQQPTHDALVPTDLVVTTVANDMNMSHDLAYQQVKDKYGADLPETYHASISGQVHYYLPSGMAGNQPPTSDETGPAAAPAPQVQQGQPMPSGRPMTPTM